MPLNEIDSYLKEKVFFIKLLSDEYLDRKIDYATARKILILILGRSRLKEKNVETIFELLDFSEEHFAQIIESALKMGQSGFDVEE